MVLLVFYYLHKGAKGAILPHKGAILPHNGAKGAIMVLRVLYYHVCWDFF